MTVKRDSRGRYGNSEARHFYTLFLKDDSCKRGEYIEEIDVFANKTGNAKKLGVLILKQDFEDGLKISRIKLNY